MENITTYESTSHTDTIESHFVIAEIYTPHSTSLSALGQHYLLFISTFPPLWNISPLNYFFFFYLAEEQPEQVVSTGFFNNFTQVQADTGHDHEEWYLFIHMARKI